MADWFRQTSGSYVHADISRLVSYMQSRLLFGADMKFQRYQNRQVPDRDGRSGPETATLRQSRVVSRIRTYQRRFRNRRWRRVQRYILDIGLSRFGDPKRGLLYYTLHMPKTLLTSEAQRE